MSREHIQAVFVQAVLDSARMPQSAQLAFVAQQTCRGLGVGSLNARAAKSGVIRLVRELARDGVTDQDVVSGAVADWFIGMGLGE